MSGLRVWFRELFGPTTEVDTVPAPRPARPGAAKSFAEDNNDFAVAVYEQLRQQPGNLFLSPFSIRTGLAMTHAGARGETAAQMRVALRISSPDEMLHVAISEIIQHLNTAGAGRYELAMANSLWGQNGAPLQSGFLDLVARYYDGSVNFLDFRRDAECARVTINTWVEDKTRQKIRELIPSGGVNADTRLVLANAVYFKAMWELQFRREATEDEPFYLETGEEVVAPLMRLNEEVPYLKGDGYQAVDLAYTGGNLSLLVLLPDRQKGIRDLEKRFSEPLLYDCVARMDNREVHVMLPRFKLRWGADVGKRVAALGMPLAFSPFEADFSGINGHEQPHEEAFSISAVIHKAFLDVNEQGTEAAAATALTAIAGRGLSPEQPRIPTFRADHPFLFAIRERRTGAILFLGRLSDPTRDN